MESPQMKGTAGEGGVSTQGSACRTAARAQREKTSQKEDPNPDGVHSHDNFETSYGS